MKKLVTLSVLTAISVTFLPIASGDVPEENFYPSVKQEAGWMGYNSDNSIEYSQPSSLYAQTSTKYPDPTRKMYLCASLDSTECTKPEIKSIVFTSVFTKCADSLDTDCIDTFGIKNEDGTFTEGTFQRNWGSNPVFSGDKARFLPAGYGPSTWSVKNLKGEVETFALHVGVKGNFDLLRNNTKSNFETFFGHIQPVKEIAGANYFANLANVTNRADGDGPGSNTYFVEQGCQIVENGKCGYRLPFDLDKNVVLKVRLSQPVQGWLHGRLKDANISMITSADNSQVVEISAKPLSIPSIYGWVKWTDLPQNVKDLYPVGSGGSARTYSDFTTTDLASRTLLSKSDVAGVRAIKEMNLWLPLLKDQAAAMKTFWVVQTIRGELPVESQACVLGKGFSGVIGANASVYSDGPPTFDQVEQSLNYTVGASHFDSKGELFKGYYQLNLRSDVARCLYGFGSAPIQAKIEVSSADGTPSVATTVISEKDGWLKMTASGFTFSTPQIKVKLSQEKAVPTPSPTPTPSASATPTPIPTSTPLAVPVVTKKATITCVKGKVTKKVTAVNPKCPTGYKKK
jgi:hypothetical protein